MYEKATMKLDYFLGLPDDDAFVGYTKRFMAEFARRAEIDLNVIGVQLMEITQFPRVWAVNYLIGTTAQVVFTCQMNAGDMYQMHLGNEAKAKGAFVGQNAELTDDEKVTSMRCWSLMRIYEKLLGERGFFMVESETSVAACLPYDPPIVANLVSTKPEIKYNCTRT